MTDLVVRNARCVATLDGERRELAGGWVAITDGLIEAVGTGEAPAATDTRAASSSSSASACVVAETRAF